MESSLSGVGRHADRVVYRRTFREPEMSRGERLLLHFGAIDWQSTIHVNGRRVADHTGGYDAFTVDITDALRPEVAAAGTASGATSGGAASGSATSAGSAGEQELAVVVYDPTDKFGQPRGKQVSKPEGIWYKPV